MVQYRARERLTEAELGKRCGLSRQTICKAETGKPISRLTEAKILNVVEGDKNGRNEIDSADRQEGERNSNA